MNCFHFGWKNCTHLVLILLMIALDGCGTLPNVKKASQEALNKDPIPAIMGSQGRLSNEETRAVLRYLEDRTKSKDLLSRQIALMEAISQNPLTTGNKVTLLADGSTVYNAMFQAIRNATDHINLETFIFDEDKTGSQLSNLLLERQSKGVQVNVIYDSVGSFRTSPSFFKRLRDGGVQVLEFNPVTSASESNGETPLTVRDHRKILIVDGKVAFTGGVNVSRGYSESFYGEIGDEDAKHTWRDTDIQVEGPAVAEFQKLFLETWARQDGPELVKGNYFPHLQSKGETLVRVVGSTPGERNRVTYMMYVAAIRFSEKSVHLTNAYFVPDSEMITALTGAAKRGVDVKVILPGATDSGLVFVAGRSFYSRLLKAGVKLYQRRDVILHAKTGVIDGSWSTVGSTNMDLWSFLRNDEVNAVILGGAFAEKMENLFEEDLRKSDQISLSDWEKRPLTERFLEWFVGIFAYWL